MKITRVFWLFILTLHIALLHAAFGQSTSGAKQASQQYFNFSDQPELQGAMKKFFDSMNVWLETPRSPTTFKEAYATGLSFKLALRAQASVEKNAIFRSQMEELASKTTLILGHLEEFIGSDAASRKLAEIGFDVAIDAVKRDELVKSAVAAVFASSVISATNSKVTATSDAFKAICRLWEEHGGPGAIGELSKKQRDAAAARRLENLYRDNPELRPSAKSPK